MSKTGSPIVGLDIGTSCVRVVMAEIADERAMHLAVASHAAELGIDLVAVGTDLYGGRRVDDPADVVALVQKLPAGSTVLFKASRVVGLDHVVRLILG